MTVRMFGEDIPLTWGDLAAGIAFLVAVVVICVGMLAMGGPR